MAEITIQDLLESGVHFGHQTRRWNPKMKKFIFTERNGIYIIDLQKTLAQLNKARKAVKEIASKGEYVLFVGTKAQAATIILEEAERCGQFFVVNRWAGGMLTNYRTIRQSVKKLEHIEQMSTDGTFEHLTKKEILLIEQQREKLSYLLEGVRRMNRLPGLLIVIDTKKEKIAVNEANRLGIPVCAILDTNCDPDPIDYPIPANDDAIKSIKILLSSLTDSLIEGRMLYTDKEGIDDKEQSVAEAEQDDRDRRRYGRRAPLATKGGMSFGADKEDGDDSGAKKTRRPSRRVGESDDKKGGRDRRGSSKRDFPRKDGQV